MLIPKSTIRFFVFSEDVGEVLSFSVVLCWEARLVPLSGNDGVVKETDVEGMELWETSLRERRERRRETTNQI